MSKTFKDKPDRYTKEDQVKKKPKEGKRFIPTKGRQKENLKHKLEDYFI